MSNLKIDSRGLMSDAEWLSNKHEYRWLLDELLRRAAKTWGVTGRRVEGHAYGDGAGFHMSGAITSRACEQNPVCRPATLYISGPPAPKPSAEERIERALAAYDSMRTEYKTFSDRVERLVRILRGEGE